jgi:hypothetical protein
VTIGAKREQEPFVGLPRLALFVVAVVNVKRAVGVPAIAASKPVALHDAKPLFLPARIA